MSQRVIIIEDEPDIGDLIELHLRREGLYVERYADGRAGLAAVNAAPPDLLVLDLMLPHIPGLEICRALRRAEATQDLPILIVSARSEDADVVCCLELGADDYVTKPFSPRVLVARAANLLRRRQKGEGERGAESMQWGEVHVDPQRFEVRVAGDLIELTRTEFRILQFLISRPGRVRARNEILEHIEGGPALDRTVDVHMASLRRKLGPAGEGLETVRGVGYRARD